MNLGIEKFIEELNKILNDETNPSIEPKEIDKTATKEYDQLFKELIRWVLQLVYLCLCIMLKNI